ncbi:hypothetical protein [Nesterenkonia marinintestina]|uniref:hypothetical protein n=1 Tax=Nesterenkonia marinintestina TaxID=2979865 RepID=UPI0021BE5681|nr:hypothetical protein [Nesterenkonia sp. GX14115]
MTEQNTTEQEQAGQISDPTSEKGVISNETPEEDSQEPEDAPETFPRSYVEKLRDESARYRQRAQQADDYAQRLHTALTAATGRLADPSDLPFDPEHLEDQDALTAALDDLLARKPHLAARKPAGSIGQGAVTQDTSTVDLAGLLRAGAGG